MSFSLKRDIEFFVNDIDSTDGVQKLAILPELELKLEANLLQVYRNIIGEDPEMLPRANVDQISPISLGFITYLKPAILDGKIGVTAPEKILYDSLGGVLGYRGPSFYMPQFGRINRLLPLYFYIKTGSAIYKIKTAYVDSLEISLDINYILIGKWTVQAISLEIYNIEDIVFTNIKDYSNIEVYLKNKLTNTVITDYNDFGKEYVFPILESSIKIQNSLMPVYDKHVKIVTGVPKDLIVTGRAVSGELKAYLSSRSSYSKDFLLSILNDINKIGKKFKVLYSLASGNNVFELCVPFAQLNIPNVDFEDVLSVIIQFTSTESLYGLNDDIVIKYYADNSDYITYSNYVLYKLAPIYYYKFDDTDDTTAINYGSSGLAYNLTRYNSAPTVNISGYYLNSKGWNLKNTRLYNANTQDYIEKLFISFWYKPISNSYEPILYFINDKFNNNISIRLIRDNISGSDFRKIDISVGNNTYVYILPVLNSWYNFTIFYDTVTQKVLIYINNIKIFDTVTSALSSSNYLIEFGSSVDSILSEFILTTFVNYDDVESIVNTLYTVSDTTEKLDGEIELLNSSYSDTLITYKGYSDYYYNTVKSYNPIAYWRFNDNDSHLIRDHISGEYPLTLYYNPQLGYDGPILDDIKSKATRFTRVGTTSNTQHALGNSTISTTNEMTFAFWVYIENDKLNLSESSNSQTLLRSSGYVDSSFKLLYRKGIFNNYVQNGKLHYNYTIGFGSYHDYYISSLYGIPQEEWTFIAISLDKNTNIAKIYKNGILQIQAVDSRISLYWPSIIALEVYKNTYSLDILSEFRISELVYFDKILSDTTVQGIYAASGITGFSYNILPEYTNTIEVLSYEPGVSIGRIKYPLYGSLSISGKLPELRNVKYLIPESGGLYNIVDSSKLPIISTSIGVHPTVSTLQTSGNISNIKTLKILYGITSANIDVNKNIINIIKQYNLNTGNIFVVCDNNPTILSNYKFINPLNSTININKYIGIVTNAIKTIKPIKGALFSYSTNVAPYESELLKYDLELYYKFNEDSGTDLIDYSGNNRNATLYNTPDLLQIGPHGTNNSIEFKKSSLEHAIYNYSLAFPDNGTIAFWFKATTPVAYDHIFQFNYAYNSGNNTNYFKFTYETTNTYWVMPYGSGWGSSFQVSVSSGVWTHIAITWDKVGNKISVYKNGTSVITDSSHSNWPTSLQPLGICRGLRDGTTHYINSNISSFSLISERLSATNISDLYAKSTASYNKEGPEVIVGTLPPPIEELQQDVIIFI